MTVKTVFCDFEVWDIVCAAKNFPKPCLICLLL